MRFDVPLKINRFPADVNWCQRTVSSGTAQRHTSRETALLYFHVSLPSLCLSREKKAHLKYECRWEAQNLLFLNFCRDPNEKKLFQRPWFAEHLGTCACWSIPFPKVSLECSHPFSWWAQGGLSTRDFKCCSVMPPSLRDFCWVKCFSQGRQMAWIFCRVAHYYKNQQWPFLALQLWFQRSGGHFCRVCTSLPSRLQWLCRQS